MRRRGFALNLPGWTPTFLALLLYLWQAYEYMQIQRPQMGLVFIGYALANAAFIWDYMRYQP